MLDTSARLLRLLSLLQSRRFWSGAELSQQLEVTERTVRRDVDRLRSLGYPVNATSGVAGGYALGAGARMPPLLLEEEEASAVVFGLRSAAAGTVVGMEEAALRALAKLEQILPARIRKRVSTLQSALVSIPGGGPRVDADLLSVVASACRDLQLLHFGYGDKLRQQSARQVEPYGVVHVGSRWYLVAFDLDRQDFRTFRVDRVTSKARVGQRFVPRPVPYGSLTAYVSRSIGSHAYPLRARILFHAPLSQVAERLPPSVGRLEVAQGERCLLETGSYQLSTLAFHLGCLGFDFTVIEPKELNDHIRELGARLTRAADSHAG